MSSKELEFNAAKAAGLHVRWDDNQGCIYVIWPGSDGEVIWNPLLSNGDAFQLISALRISTFYPDFEACGSVVGVGSPEAGGVKAEGGLNEAGYRRAIVEVAAKMYAGGFVLKR